MIIQKLIHGIGKWLYSDEIDKCDQELEELTKGKQFPDEDSVLKRLESQLNDYSSELIVRVPELIERGIDNHALSYLEPLQSLWLEIIDNVDTESNVKINLNYTESGASIEITGDTIKEEL